MRWHKLTVRRRRPRIVHPRQTEFVTRLEQADTGKRDEGQCAFGVWADPVLLLALSGLWIALAIVFNGEPEIDRQVSEAFFRAQACTDGTARAVCGIFPAGADAALRSIRQVFHYLPIAAAVVVAAGLAKELASGRALSDPRPRVAATALAALVLGPGLLVNLLLKEHWGRPRPVATDLFGGPYPFVPAARWSDACPTNCSFVSGEASAIFWLFCLIPLLPAGYRRAGSLVIAAVAVFTSGLRVAFGGHYLSDVVLGGLSTPIVFCGLAVLVGRWAPRVEKRR